MGGETRPEIQSIIFEPDYPAGDYERQDFNVCTEVTHATYMLHMNAFSDPMSEDELANARHAHARMGYNFQVTQVAVAESSDAGLVDVYVTVAQTGVAPF